MCLFEECIAPRRNKPEAILCSTISLEDYLLSLEAHTNLSHEQQDGE